MSSEGSPRLIWRCPADLLEQIEADIALSHQTRRGEPWTTTAYIKAAIVEFLRKRRASRDRSKRGQSLSAVWLTTPSGWACRCRPWPRTAWTWAPPS